MIRLLILWTLNTKKRGEDEDQISESFFKKEKAKKGHLLSNNARIERRLHNATLLYFYFCPFLQFCIKFSIILVKTTRNKDRSFLSFILSFFMLLDSNLLMEHEDSWIIFVLIIPYKKETTRKSRDWKDIRGGSRNKDKNRVLFVNVLDELEEHQEASPRSSEVRHSTSL